ncbi:MAG TPA: NAD-dependent epimerase/dehydratase family protein, partial [Candidatus Synoicihabitans sp.]|nr:NAD-dependent epimerase/dehydratase family protein [Candidatus Synoicihabitans sp.]
TPAEIQRVLELRPLGIEFIEGTVTDAAALARAAEGMKVIYHLAAAQHEANVPEAHFAAINVAGTRNVLAAAAAAGAARVVYGSTIGVYGASGAEPVHEQTPLQPDSAYGRTKLAAEEVVRGAAPEITTAIVRITETYGPGDYRLLKLFRGIARRRFIRIGSGANLHHPIYIDDLVEALRQAAAAPAAVTGPLVVCGPTPLSTDAMIDAVARAVDAAPPRVHWPMAPFQGAATLCERVCVPLGLHPPLHRRRLDFFRKSFAFNGSEARRQLNFTPQVDFETGAQRTAQWYRERQLL